MSEYSTQDHYAIKQLVCLNYCQTRRLIYVFLLKRMFGFKIQKCYKKHPKSTKFLAGIVDTPLYACVTHESRVSQNRVKSRGEMAAHPVRRHSSRRGLTGISMFSGPNDTGTVVRDLTRDNTNRLKECATTRSELEGWTVPIEKRSFRRRNSFEMSVKEHPSKNQRDHYYNTVGCTISPKMRTLNNYLFSPKKEPPGIV